MTIKTTNNVYWIIRDLFISRWNLKPVASKDEFKRDLYAQTMPAASTMFSMLNISVSTAGFNKVWFELFADMLSIEGLYIIEPELEA